LDGVRTRTRAEAHPATRRARNVAPHLTAYGYHADNPLPLTEQIPVRGTSEHCYSEQKAACETVLAQTTDGSKLEVFVAPPVHRRRAEGNRSG
jgi:UDP-glucose 4-epimerase